MLFIATRLYFDEHKDINLPFGIWEYDDNILKYKNRTQALAGCKKCSHSIDEIEISEKEIENAFFEKKAVPIGIYDFNANDAIEDGFLFGYYCVIEYMAHAIQKMIHPQLEHQIVPYTAVELVAEKEYPSILQDTKHLITVCQCALMYDNPGVGFFKVIRYAKDHPSLTGIEFYKEFLQTSLVTYKGSKHAMDYIGIDMLEEYKRALGVQCGCDLHYYNKVIDSFKMDYQTGECGLLRWLYTGDVRNREQFLALTDAYGLPIIESPNFTQMPTSSETHKPYLEVATILGFELWFRRFQKKDGDKCPWYHICKQTEYNPDTKVDEFCGKEQWKKTKACLMSQSLKYLYLYD